MNIYVCGYTVRFPNSEYGGLLIVIAENRKRCGQIITAEYGKKDGFNLSISVNTAKEFPLDPQAQLRRTHCRRIYHLRSAG